MQEEDPQQVPLLQPAHVNDRQLGKVVTTIRQMISVENITGKVFWLVDLFSEEQHYQ